jgi:hypothetical protein
MNLNTARVFVRDIVEAERFYGAKLGLAFKAGNRDHGDCVFSAGSTELVVEVVGSDAPHEDQALVGRFTGSQTSTRSILNWPPPVSISLASRRGSSGAVRWQRF